ncbi:MAG: response regulator [Chloroflexi bacterium]|nr:response regulator [Chloroflexota bacterium]
MDEREFYTWVHDALMHYGDSIHLRENPLLERLSALQPEEDRISKLRDLLRRAVEALKPPETVPYGQPEWLPYRILWGRCIQRRNQIQLCDELALSRSTFYRYQAQAIHEVARTLWETELGICATERTPQPDEAEEPALAEAARLAYRATRQVVHLGNLVLDVQRIMSSLLEQQGTTLQVRIMPDVGEVYGDPAVLRQILIHALSGALRVGAGPKLTLSISAEPEKTVCRIHGLAAITGLPLAHDHLAKTPELMLSRRLLDIYEGRLFFEDEDTTSPVIGFVLPSVRPPTILIVEDDPDTIELYQRYLRRAGFALHLAQSGNEIWALLEQNRPDLILLDVLMPKEDGWLVLQRLQTLPETADIPVIVYSVLPQPTLALSLGAREVLLKPVQEDALLHAVRQVLGSEDNADQRPRSSLVNNAQNGADRCRADS